MEVGAAVPVPPVAGVTPASGPAQVAVPEKAVASAPPATFTPAPAIRPTIEDKIEIDLALIALRSQG